MNLFDNQSQTAFIYRVSILEVMTKYSQKEFITIETRTAYTETAARKILQQLSKKYSLQQYGNNPHTGHQAIINF